MSEHKKKKNPAATMMMTSLAYIVLGIVTVVFPQKVLDVLCYALGGAMTVYGLFNIISFFVDREGGMYFELVIGVISTGFGIFALFSPTSIAAIINIPIGIIIIVDSIMDMKHSLTLRSLGMRKWWIPFIIGQYLIVTFGGEMFSVVPLSWKDWGIIIGSTSLVLWIGEIGRLIERWRK